MANWLVPKGKTHAEQLEFAAEKAAARQKRDPHCSYWMGKKGLDDYNDATVDKTGIEWLLKLNTVRRRIANFAMIVLDRDISVVFSTGNDSYSTDSKGREQLVISATTDPKKFDGNCGLTLHEASHIKWSKFSTREKESIPLFQWLERFSKVSQQMITEEVSNLGTSIGLTMLDIAKDLQFIVNVMEDRRIDWLMYEHAEGYQAYYDAFYEESWHTPRISGMMLSKLTHQPLVDCYRFHICNMTNPVFDPTVLPGLEEITNLINLKDIRRFGRDDKWQSYHTKTVPDAAVSVRYPIDVLPDMIQTGIAILKIIYTHATAMGMALPNKPEPKKGKNGKAKWQKGMKFAKGDPNNYDHGQGQEVSLDPDDYTPEEFAELMKEIEEMVAGNFNKESLTAQQAAALQEITRSEASMQLVGDKDVGKTNCVIYRKLTEGLMRSPRFIFAGSSSRENIEAIKQGISLGESLVSKLTVLAEETTITYSHQDHGKLAKRLIHTLGFNSKNVFEQKHVYKHDPIFIHMSLDSSGSMSGSKWYQTIKLATALAKIAEKVSTIDVVISLRAGDDMVRVLIAYDSRTDPFNKITRFFPRLHASGGTPEGLAFDSLRGVIDENNTSRRRKYFINISDGEPSFHCTGTDGNQVGYGGDSAFAHTRRRIAQFKKDGVQVMSYFVNDGYNNRDAFLKMYGKDAQFINVGDISQIARTMNQMMLKGERVLDKSV